MRTRSLLLIGMTACVICGISAAAEIASVEVDHLAVLTRANPDQSVLDSADPSLGYEHYNDSYRKYTSIVTMFDLSAYRGATVTGDGQIKFYARRNGGDTYYANGFNISKLNAPFVFDEVTWNQRSSGNSWSGSDALRPFYNRGGVQDVSGVIGTFHVGEGQAKTDPNPYTLVVVTVSQETIQNWIDSQNCGILFAPTNLNQTATYSQVDIAGVTNSTYDAPTLEFNYVPEPATVGLLVVGLGAVIRRR